MGEMSCYLILMKYLSISLPPTAYAEAALIDRYYEDGYDCGRSVLPPPPPPPSSGQPAFKGRIGGRREPGGREGAEEPEGAGEPEGGGV